MCGMRIEYEYLDTCAILDATALYERLGDLRCRYPNWRVIALVRTV